MKKRRSGEKIMVFVLTLSLRAGCGLACAAKQSRRYHTRGGCFGFLCAMPSRKPRNDMWVKLALCFQLHYLLRQCFPSQLQGTQFQFFLFVFMGYGF